MAQILTFLAVFAIGALFGAQLAMSWCKHELDKELESEWDKFMESARKQREEESEPKTYAADKCHFPEGVDYHKTTDKEA
jgi:hypothetical protein